MFATALILVMLSVLLVVLGSLAHVPPLGLVAGVLAVLCLAAAGVTFVIGARREDRAHGN